MHGVKRPEHTIGPTFKSVARVATAVAANLPTAVVPSQTGAARTPGVSELQSLEPSITVLRNTDRLPLASGRHLSTKAAVRCWIIKICLNPLHVSTCYVLSGHQRLLGSHADCNAIAKLHKRSAEMGSWLSTSPLGKYASCNLIKM